MPALETMLENLHLAYFRQTSSDDRAELKRIAKKIIYTAELRGIIPHVQSERLSDNVYNWDTFNHIKA